MKQANLFCLVLSPWDLPNHGASRRTLGVFRKLLIIEPFFQWKLNKIKTENCIGIWKHSWCCWKALDESNLIKFTSQFSELSCGRYWILNDFVVKNSNNLQKLSLEGKFSWALNVFTLGPMAQATLVVFQKT